MGDEAHAWRAGGCHCGAVRFEAELPAHLKATGTGVNMLALNILMVGGLSLAVGARVVVRHAGEAGEMRIAFRNFDQLDDLCRRLCQPAR